jgi:hypothetical protein
MTHVLEIPLVTVTMPTWNSAKYIIRELYELEEYRFTTVNKVEWILSLLYNQYDLAVIKAACFYKYQIIDPLFMELDVCRKLFRQYFISFDEVLENTTYVATVPVVDMEYRYMYISYVDY